jgi:acetyltransferase-like isoleucine patch superfamily enzyme
MKALVQLLATLTVLPLVLLYALGCGLLGTYRVFPGYSQLVSLVPGLLGIHLRKAFYALVLPRCGHDACLCFGTVISHPTTHIGDRVYVGPFGALGDVTLEEDVLLGSHVSIMNGSGQHGIERLDVPIREQPGTYPHVTIGQDTWIGDRAVIMADVGKHCVIGAASVVTTPIPDYAIAVGSPARVVRYRNQIDEQTRSPATAPGTDRPVQSCSDACLPISRLEGS